MREDLVRRAEALGLNVTHAYLVDLWDDLHMHMYGGDFDNEAEAEEWLEGQLDAEEESRQPRAEKRGTIDADWAREKRAEMGAAR